MPSDWCPLTSPNYHEIVLSDVADRSAKASENANTVTSSNPGMSDSLYSGVWQVVMEAKWSMPGRHRWDAGHQGLVG